MTTRWTRRALAATVVGVAALIGSPPAAHADDYADTLVVNGTVTADGTVKITETLTFPTAAPAQITQRLATGEMATRHDKYVFDISDVSAKAGSGTASVSMSTDGDYRVVTITTGGAKTVTLNYTVKGASRAQQVGNTSRTLVSWRVLQGLSVGVKQASGTFEVPGVINFVDCKSGPPAAPGPCGTVAGGTHDSPNPTFTDGPRGPGEAITMSFGISSGAVKPDGQLKRLWSLDQAFSVNSKTLLASLLPLLLGGLALYLLHRRNGRDVTPSTVAPVAEFAPVGEGQARFTVLEGVRPGEVGTLADERVDPVDVTATLLDLAVRGHVRIIEQPRTGAHQPLDWTFERLSSDEPLLGYEKTLLDAIAPEGGTAVPVSQIGGAVSAVVPQVQSELYDEVVSRGWFSRRPDSTRNTWSLIGWGALAIAVIATVLLVAFTTFGLLGLALIALALGLLVIGQQMPRRTASGSALLGGLAALAHQLQVQQTNQAPKGEEYDEPSRVLPYAVVLGGKERWLQAISDADDDPGVPDPTDLSWYHAPETWQVSDLPQSINAFITTVQGHLYAR